MNTGIVIRVGGSTSSTWLEKPLDFGSSPDDLRLTTDLDKALRFRSMSDAELELHVLRAAIPGMTFSADLPTHLPSPVSIGDVDAATLSRRG